MRQADLIRDYLIANVSTDYLPCAIWQEDRYPFTLAASKVMLTMQSGRAVDAFTQQIDVDVLMFSKANADGADLTALYDEATAALLYIKTNFIINANIRPTITQDVTGPYVNGQNRYFYRFSMLTYSEEP